MRRSTSSSTTPRPHGIRPVVRRDDSGVLLRFRGDERLGRVGPGDRGGARHAQRGAGWILSISSTRRGRARSAVRPDSTFGACLYGGTKAMIDRITTGAAMDLYDDNIAVNTLAPEYSIATENALTVPASPPATPNRRRPSRRRHWPCAPETRRLLTGGSLATSACWWSSNVRSARSTAPRSYRDGSPPTSTRLASARATCRPSSDPKTHPLVPRTPRTSLATIVCYRLLQEAPPCHSSLG